MYVPSQILTVKLKTLPNASNAQKDINSTTKGFVKSTFKS